MCVCLRVRVCVCVCVCVYVYVCARNALPPYSKTTPEKAVTPSPKKPLKEGLNGYSNKNRKTQFLLKPKRR